MRLILFDIDGTLISAHGVGHRSFVRAMQSVFGTAGPHDTYDWRGKTDPWIVRDLMRMAGVPDSVLDARLGECFERYVCFLEALLADGHPVDVLPGIDRLVRALAAREDVLVGLLTGNVKPGAETKLRSTGLLPFFRLGAYGSDDADRRRLPAIARERARALTGVEIPFANTLIIGDTPLDVDCARACGAVAVAVATGHYSLSELQAVEPDLVFQDFGDVERSLRQLLTFSPGSRQVQSGSARATQEGS
ncbi:MAG: haloacid dehalogenase-like hydrolase [candidate division NC10 bacterium]|nr:haloacid dehalogenase-like hydrolase [candidate division NC10 bacterium]